MRLWNSRLLAGVCGDFFYLLQVVDVVTSHGFYDGPEGHGSALGVGGGVVAILFGDGGEEAQVPGTGSLEEGQGGVEVVGGVALGPVTLIEGLDDGVLFAEGL